MLLSWHATPKKSVFILGWWVRWLNCFACYQEQRHQERRWICLHCALLPFEEHQSLVKLFLFAVMPLKVLYVTTLNIQVFSWGKSLGENDRNLNLHVQDRRCETNGRNVRRSSILSVFRSEVVYTSKWFHLKFRAGGDCVCCAESRHQYEEAYCFFH